MKIPHIAPPNAVIRYFLLAGVLAFSGYLYTKGHSLLLLVLGPPVHIASFVLSWIESLIEFEPKKIDFVFLLPATIFYFGLIGFLLKKLLHEPGLIRLVGVLGLFAFLVFIHLYAWQDLVSYFSEGPA